MARAIWNIQGGGGISKKEISNVTITITDNAAVLNEGEAVTAVCNEKVFTSTIIKGVCKIYSTEVGTYAITAGKYSTMLICPYYGQFSTDIYSGTLKVTCTDVDGNGKTCQVRSCDDDYNFTSNYNLTQTFDNALELVFMGIPTGKYLITVDEKYRFYKEIISIQNVNSTEVELKQWLYKDGNECVYNTGGWMKCKISSYTEVCAGKNGKSSTASQKVEFLSDRIHLEHSWYAPINHWTTVSQHIYNYYTRAGVQSYAFFGTKNTILDLKKYKKLMLVKSGASAVAIRSGAANSSETTTATATVALQTTANDSNIALVDGEYYIVMGHSVSYATAPISSDAYSAISGSFADDIRKVYLV